MPPADEPFTILVCACGKRLKARGATPGRMGQCPACGGTLRAPDEPGIVDKYAVEPEPPTSVREPSIDEHPARVGTTIKKPRKSRGPVGREGLVKIPKRIDGTLGGNVLYPLWDGNGVAMLLFLPPVLWLTSLMSIGLVPSFVIGADLPMKMGAMTMIFPMLVMMTFALGYVLIFLHGVITISAENETHHPRVPTWQIGPTLAVLGKTACAIATGLLVSGPLLFVFTRTMQETPGFRDWLVLAWLAAPGIAYAGIALAAILRQDTVVAANPISVLGSLAKAGAEGLAIAILLAVWAGLVFTSGVLLFRLPALGFLAVLAGLWLFWVAAIYSAIVTCRLLGLFVHRNARAMDWPVQGRRWNI